MTDKLYSRRKIKLPKISFKKINFLKFLIFATIVIMFLGVILFFRAAYPIFKASCETAASSKTTSIVTEEVLNVMQDYSYNDLVTIDKNADGEIVLLEVKSVPVNRLIANIVSRIQTRIDNSPRTTVYINTGTITGISVLSTVGPRFNIELETSRKDRT